MNRFILASLACILLLPACDRTPEAPPETENAEEKEEIVVFTEAERKFMLAYIDRTLTLCYGKIGQMDKQLDAFQRAIKSAPEEEKLELRKAYIYALAVMGKMERLKEECRNLEAEIGTEEFKKIPMPMQRVNITPFPEPGEEAVHTVMIPIHWDWPPTKEVAQTPEEEFIRARSVSE